LSLIIKNHNSKKLFIVIFSLTFFIFLFTSDGHRYTIDEHLGQEMAHKMTTLVPDPEYIQGESKNYFHIPLFNPHNTGPLCSNGITCYPVSFFYSVTQVPFIAINHFSSVITPDTLILDVNDFTDQHYNFWRNSEKPDLVFMELFYGPVFTALSISIFFLICLEHKFSTRTSIVLSLLLAFSTMMWAYSGTSLNVVPALFFVLLGYFFYKKSQFKHELNFLILSSVSFGFAFLIRESSVLFVIPIWILILINVFRKKTKILLFICFTIPLFFSYFLSKFILSLRWYPDPKEISTQALNNPLVTFDFVYDIFIIINTLTPNGFSFLIHLYGLLFAPGLGLFVFSPILLTIFFAFPDFFRKNKTECILLLSFLLIHLVYFANIGQSWAGFVAWGSRYLLMIIPFLLIPLGASLETRNKKFMFVLLVTLGLLGIFFNITYVTQDVAWFVWGQPGSQTTGLYSLSYPNEICDYECQWIESFAYINNVTIWTFQYSQLTQSILLMFQTLQQDIYLLHVIGYNGYFAILLPTTSFLIYLLWRISRRTFDTLIKS
jgi:hypothetical protein|tara:strand:+ start:2006 stop:3649 length:1644 start_codon:yes stop_codon:yes gene_type:complete